MLLGWPRALCTSIPTEHHHRSQPKVEYQIPRILLKSFHTSLASIRPISTVSNYSHTKCSGSIRYCLGTLSKYHFLKSGYVTKHPTNNMLCTGDVIKSGLEDAVVDRIFQILLRDDNYWLISETFRNDSIYRGKGQQLLVEAISFSAFACVVALVKGETLLTVDIDLPDSYGRFPLHYAAEMLDPCITELLLYLGARADARTVKEQLLPLHLALEKFVCHRRLKEWTPKHSIFKLITVLCLPRMQNQLESIGLLSWTSEVTEEEFLQYARYGKLKELAALLVVAHKKLTGPMQTVLNTIPSLQIDVKKKQNLLLLLEVFQRAGDAIEAYVKQEKIGVSVDQSVNTVKCLLHEAGFPLKHEDTALNCFQWYRQMGLTNLTECRWKSKDIHMPHYGKSGYRWMVHNKSSEACRVVDIENFNYDEDEDFDDLVRDELGSSFSSDNKEEMISAILQNEILRGNGQYLLLEACSFRAINCIMALVKGEAHVTVDINLPDSIGNFPIHHVAKIFDPSVTELLLYLGARADTRTVGQRLLPLHIALGKFINNRRLTQWSEWDSKHSIFKLIILLCLPILQDRLESIGLLAYSIEETEEEFLRLARYGQLKELATLLMVFHKRLSGPMQKVRNLSLALIREKRKQNLFLLLEVFERAGDAIEAYVKQEKYGVSVDHSVKTVACLLQEAGFTLKREDTDLNDFHWYGLLEDKNMTLCKCMALSKDMTECNCSREPKDIHMPHYGKSGYRWMTYNKSSVACRVVNEEILNADKLGVKPVPNEQSNSTKYSSITTIHDRGVPGAIRGFHSQTGVEAKAKDKICGKAWIHPLLDVSSRRKPRTLLASVIKGFLKHMIS